MKKIQNKKGIVVSGILVLFILVISVTYAMNQKSGTNIERKVSQDGQTRLEEFIVNKLKDDYFHPNYVEVQSQKWKDHEVVAKYTYEVENKTGEGVMYAMLASTQFKYIDGVHSLVTLSNPFTHQGLGYSNGNEQLSVISGFINDKEITSIQIFYDDNSIEWLKIGKEQDTFMSTHWNEHKNVTAMIAYDRKKREVYKYSWK